MRGLSTSTRRVAAALLLVLIFSTSNALAVTRESTGARSWLESVQSWIAKRVPALIAAFGEKPGIPPG